MPKTKNTKSPQNKKDTKSSDPKATEGEKTTKKQSLLTRIRNNRFKILIALIIVGLAILAYAYKSLFVAATVNGEPILRYTLITTAEQVAGPQVLEQLVTEKIIEQEAQERGITVSQEELTQAFDELATQYKDQGVEIQTLLDQNNVTREEIEANLRPQVLQDKLIENEGIVVTEEEIDEFFSENEDLVPQDPSEMESTRESVRESLRSRKVQQFLQQLRTEANVDYFLQ